MAIEERNLIPVLDEVLSFMEDSLSEYSRSQAQIDLLQNKIAQHDRVVLEKVAEFKKHAFDGDKLKNTLNNMVQMRLLSPHDSAKIASKVDNDPNAIFELLTKMAEAMIAPSEGSELIEDKDFVLDDPDGWDDMAEGKAVRVRP
jgi:hypothetical protein